MSKDWGDDLVVIGRPPRHARSLRISTWITTNLRRMYWPMATNVLPRDVIKLLNQAGVKFVLVGAHSISGWLIEPRATQDVDVLVLSQHRKAVQVVHNAYPHLIVQELPVVTRFLDPNNDNLAVIDLMRSQEDLFKAVPKNAIQVGKTYRVPDVEMALALKYAAIASPNRELRKKSIDEGDFRSMAMKNYAKIDPDKLFSLGEMVKNGGGPEIVQMVEDAYADRPFQRS